MLGSLVGAHLNADPSGSVSADNLFIWVLGHFGWAALVLLVLREAFRVACFGRSTVATVTLSALWRVAAMVGVSRGVGGVGIVDRFAGVGANQKRDGS